MFLTYSLSTANTRPLTCCHILRYTVCDNVYCILYANIFGSTMWVFTRARNVNRLLENHLGLNIHRSCQMDNTILHNYTSFGCYGVGFSIIIPIFSKHR